MFVRASGEFAVRKAAVSSYRPLSVLIILCLHQSYFVITPTTLPPLSLSALISPYLLQAELLGLHALNGVYELMLAEFQTMPSAAAGWEEVRKPGDDGCLRLE